MLDSQIVCSSGFEPMFVDNTSETGSRTITPLPTDIEKQTRFVAHKIIGHKTTVLKFGFFEIKTISNNL